HSCMGQVSLASAQIFLEDNPHVMQFVSGHVKGEATHGCAVTAYYPSPEPLVRPERSKQRDAGGSHNLELLQKIGKGTAVESCKAHILFLVETRQRPAVIAGKAQGAMRKNTLIIAHVPHYLFQIPLSRGISKCACNLVVERRQHRDSALDLCSQSAYDVIALDKVDISLGVGSVFPGLRPSGRDVSSNVHASDTT